MKPLNKRLDEIESKMQPNDNDYPDTLDFLKGAVVSREGKGKTEKVRLINPNGIKLI